MRVLALPAFIICNNLGRYFFSLNALDHLLRILAHSRARSVVCLGCPSVHEALVAAGTGSV